MKNTAMSGEASEVDALGWGAALRLFESDLRRHGSVDKTLRAYAAEVRRLAEWATARQLRPEAVDLRVLREYAAAAGVRKLGAFRAFFRVMRHHGLIAQNPVDLVAAPSAPPKLDQIPAVTPLQVRDRAIFELAHARGMRAEEIVGLDVGAIGADAVPTLAHYLARARPALAAGDGETALFLSKSGRRLSSSDVRRRLAPQLLPGGADHRTIPDLRGPAPVSTTPTYTRVDSARLRMAYARSHPRA